MMRGKGMRRRAIYILIIVAIVILTIHMMLPQEPRAFRKYVYRPIPDSVSQIKTDLDSGWFNWSGRRQVLRFKIGPGDVETIVRSRPFEEYESITFNGQSLEWKNPKGPLQNPSRAGETEDMALYWTKTPPEWFQLDGWDQVQVYRLREKWGKSRRFHVQVLIYNEQLGEAYFINYVEGH